MAVIDNLFQSLVSYGGETINERVYHYLGNLGYTGAINDRLSKYEHEGKKGWQGLIKGFGLEGAPGLIRHRLFGGGQQGVMYVPQPTYLGQQVLFQDSAGTTPVTADGQPVGYIKDLSGNGNHATQATAAKKFLYSNTGSVAQVAHDGVDDRLVSTPFSTTKTVMLAVRRKDLNSLILLWGQTISYFAFIFETGSGSTALSNYAGAPIFYVDNVQMTTRDDMHQATSDLGWHIVEATGLDTALWTEMKLGDRSSYIAGFDLGGWLAFDSSDAADRDKARQYLADLAGVTL